MSDVNEAKEQVVAIAHRAYALRIQTGDGGNLSIRVPDKEIVIIKQSRCSFADCSVDNLVMVNMDGQVIEGDAKPSSELGTHLTIYRERKDVYAIFHCHAPWSIAAASSRPEIPPMTYHAEAKLGHVPVVDAPPATMHNEVSSCLRQQPTLKAFVHRKHGVFAFDKTLARALYHAELVEETSQIAYLADSRL